MINATKYGDVLETRLIHSARSLFRKSKWLFPDDNAPCHRAKLVKIVDASPLNISDELASTVSICKSPSKIYGIE